MPFFNLDLIFLICMTFYFHVKNANIVFSLGSNPNSPRKNRPGAPVKCVDPVLIMKVFNQVYGSYVTSDQISGSNDDGFPVQQKLLLCALLVFTKFSKQREPTVGKVRFDYLFTGACAGFVVKG